MALEINLHESTLPLDEFAEEAFERAMIAWREARTRFDTVEPAHLSPESREAYYRALVRMGLWADARVAGASESDEPTETPAEDEPTSETEIE